MEMLGVPGLVIRPAVGEERADPSLPPPELVKALAAAKAREAAADAEADDAVIAADTIVVLDGRVYGKPRSAAEAADMLRALSGRTHEVYTGVCVLRGGVELCRCDRSLVTFRALSEAAIDEYVARVRPLDRAGAYDIDENGDLIVASYTGEYENIMGLPVEPLRRFGII